MVAIPFRRGLQCRDVRTTTGLGNRQGADGLAGEDGWQYPSLQCLRTIFDDGGHPYAMAHQAGGDTTTAGHGELLGGDDHVEQVRFDAAVLLRITQRNQANIGRFAVEFPRESAGLVPFDDTCSTWVG